MKKMLCAILCVLTVLTCSVSAQTMEAYIDALGKTLVWETDADGLMYTAEPEDGIVLSLCLKENEIVAVTVEAMQDIPHERLSEYLSACGITDLETVFALTGEEKYVKTSVDGLTVVLLSYEVRYGYCVTASEGYDELVWLSVHGGEKYHKDPTCSGMDVARLVTLEAAQALGRGCCEKE